VASGLETSSGKTTIGRNCQRENRKPVFGNFVVSPRILELVTVQAVEGFTWQVSRRRRNATSKDGDCLQGAVEKKETGKTFLRGTFPETTSRGPPMRMGRPRSAKKSPGGGAGKRIRTGSLAQNFGISRSPLREVENVSNVEKRKKDTEERYQPTGRAGPRLAHRPGGTTQQSKESLRDRRIRQRGERYT